MRPIVAFAAACLTVFATTAPASSGGPAVPSFLTYRNDGVVFVYVNGPRNGTVPACAVPTGEYFRYAGGLLAAHAAAEGIWYKGTGDCDPSSPDTESLLEFHTAI
jgi:hypothetical protein